MKSVGFLFVSIVPDEPTCIIREQTPSRCVSPDLRIRHVADGLLELGRAFGHLPVQGVFRGRIDNKGRSICVTRCVLCSSFLPGHSKAFFVARAREVAFRVVEDGAERNYFMKHECNVCLLLE